MSYYRSSKFYLQIQQQNCLRKAFSNHALNTKYNVLFMGRDEFSCLVLQELFTATDVWEDITIATHPDTRVGRRGSQLSISPLKALGKSLDLKVHTIPHTKPEYKLWKLPSPFYPTSTPPPNNHLLVTASFGRILPQSQLSLFQPTKRLNVHPSLLPAYRGPAPIQHTLINGETETGVCVIEMLKKKEGIDAGGIWGSTKLQIPEDIEFTPLRSMLAKEGGKLLVSVLRDMQAGRAAPTPQADVKTAPFAPMISIADSSIDFSHMTAEAIVRRHRGISHQRPLITHLTMYGGKTLQLHSLSVLTDYPRNLSSSPGMALYDKRSNALLIRCAEGSVLCVPMVKQEGKALIDAGAWWNGAKSLGLVIQGEVQLGLPRYRP